MSVFLAAGALIGAAAGGTLGYAAGGATGAAIGVGVGAVGGLGLGAVAYELSRPRCFCPPMLYPYFYYAVPIFYFGPRLYYTTAF